MIVYVSGKWLHETDASVSFQDRAVQFADAVYEVVPIYKGRYFNMEAHLARLQHGLESLRIASRAVGLMPVFEELLRQHTNLQRGILYVQISRGAAPRIHGLPKIAQPTVVAYVKPVTPNLRLQAQGGRALLVEDLRWQLCNIKTTGLLLNCLAKEEALEQGYDDAIFHRGAIITEASASNLFVITKDTLLTHPTGPWILPGITRQVVIELANKLGIEVREVQFTIEELLAADELFLTGTTSEVMPYVEVNGTAIGRGDVGPVTRRLQEVYQQATAQ